VGCNDLLTSDGGNLRQVRSWTEYLDLVCDASYGCLNTGSNRREDVFSIGSGNCFPGLVLSRETSLVTPLMDLYGYLVRMLVGHRSEESTSRRRVGFRSRRFQSEKSFQIPDGRIDGSCKLTFYLLYRYSQICFL
jgi:16S rRNA G527 N7-methylase RsmG